MAKPLRKIDAFYGVPNLSRLFPPPAQGVYRYFEGADQYPFEQNGTRSYECWNAIPT